MFGKKKNPFPNPFNAPTLPFDMMMPDPFAGAQDFDVALGLSEGQTGFEEISSNYDVIDSFTGKPRKRRNNKSMYSLDRQERMLSGQEPLRAEEENYFQGGMDAFGRPLTE